MRHVNKGHVCLGGGGGSCYLLVAVAVLWCLGIAGCWRESIFGKGVNSSLAFFPDTLILCILVYFFRLPILEEWVSKQTV